MNIFNALLVALVFMAVGFAQASTINNFDTTLTTSNIGGLHITGTGIAALDSIGILTVDLKATISAGATMNENIIYQFSGAWDGTTFTPNSGTRDIISCTSSDPLSLQCPVIPSGTSSIDSLSFSGTVNISGGRIFLAPTGETEPLFIYTFTPTAVPIPAAIWLFGSGLIGLTGVMRKRKIS